MYAIPRNGFLPPSHDVVDSIIRFVPPNAITGYAVKNTSYTNCLELHIIITSDRVDSRGLLRQPGVSTMAILGPFRLGFGQEPVCAATTSDDVWWARVQS